MKKTTPFLVMIVLSAAICAFAFAGCTASQTTAAKTNTMTLDEALQKSAETRQKISDIKEAYNTAKEADKATNASSSTLDAAKAAAQEKIDSVKQQIEDEKKAWKETLSN